MLLKDSQFPEYKIIRFKQSAKATLGNIISGQSLQICATLEPGWKDNIRNNPRTKENEASCLPEGRYLCVKYSSEKFSDTWEITGAPGRSKVLFHSLVYADQSEGCIGVGLSHGEHQGIPFVNNGKKAMIKLRTALPQKFWLTIICDGFTNSLCDFNPKNDRLQSLLIKEECENVVMEKNNQFNQKSL